jgi:hypothetical protein
MRKNSLTSHRKYATDIQHITDALVAAGYTSLDKQAKALGIHRATAWTIVRSKHKLGRLNVETTEQMLASSHLPPSVRTVVEQYRAERSVCVRRNERRPTRFQESTEQKRDRLQSS